MTVNTWATLGTPVSICTFQNILYTSVSEPEQLSVSIVRKRGLLLGIWCTPWAVPASQWYLNKPVNQLINHFFKELRFRHKI